MKSVLENHREGTAAAAPRQSHGKKKKTARCGEERRAGAGGTEDSPQCGTATASECQNNTKSTP